MKKKYSRPRRPGIAAATATLAVGAVIAGVGVAGARENVTIYSVEAGGPCFSLEDKSTCAPGERPTRTIRTGDTVVWNFKSGGIHNAARKTPDSPDPAWNARDRPPLILDGGSQQYTFGVPGTYVYVCQAHVTTMEGTIVVEGQPVEVEQPSPDPEDPVVTPSPTPTSTPTATFTPSGGSTITDDHLNTPDPGRAAKDTTAPRLASPSVRRVKAGAVLRFRVSEPSTVTVTVRRHGSKTTLTSARFHVAAGSRQLTVRSKTLTRRGTYIVTWRSVDAMGNKSAAVSKRLQVR